ncbi:MAG: adenylate kinase [Chloroflexota bacterium]
MDIAVIGPPGAGKGTHAQSVISEFGLNYISTGELLRDNLEQETGLGFMAQGYRDRGEMVPTQVIDAMIVDFLGKVSPDTQLLFNGFPRSVYQAEFLDKLFSKTNRTLGAVIFLKTSDDEIEQRISERLICSACQAPFHKRFYPFRSCPYDRCTGEHLYRRTDDTPEMVSDRLNTFYRNNEPIIDYYQKTDRLFIVEGEGDLLRVDQAIVNVVRKILNDEAQPATRSEVEQIRFLKPAVPDPVTVIDIRQTLDIIFLGAPGAGKGTQAEVVSQQFNIERIATGDIFRQNIKNQTQLGKVAKTYIDHGKLVPDNVTESMVRDRLSQSDVEHGFILDGFPRNLPQAEALTAMMTSLKRRVSGVLYLSVADEEIIRRLSGRLMCPTCQRPYHEQFNPERICLNPSCEKEPLYQRDDDRPETVKARLKIFHGETAPLVDYYRKAGLLIEINGQGELTDIGHQVREAVEGLYSLLPQS